MSDVKQFNACIYARLSREDGDKAESDSIISQKALIREFISKHPEITVVSEKSDDGYSGVNFDRPAFQEMMEEIRSGKVNCVVVKDLSRFGRNYIEAGNYIERVFPFIGVRFIAVNDSYDSLERGAADSLIIPFKNLINDAYCKDISVKIRTQLDIKRKNGQFIGAFAVYGYCKDPEDHNHLVPDPEAAQVVESVFRWKLQGMSQGRIADRLNEGGVLSPMEYKLAQGIRVQTSFRVHHKALWSAQAVTRILTNEVYTGVLIQGRTTTPNYKVKKVIEKDVAEWIRIEDAHEAIVDRGMFETVQILMKKDLRTAPSRRNVYPFSGYLKCPDCGQNLVRKKYKSGSREYEYYICSTWKDGRGCASHRIREKDVYACVLQAIRGRIESVLEIERLNSMADALPQDKRNVFQYDVQIVKLREEIEQNQMFSLKLFETLQSGLITQEEYVLFKKAYKDRIRSAEAAIAAAEKERDAQTDRNKADCAWIEEFKRYAGITKVDRMAVVNLIEQILVYDDRHMDIRFRFADEFDCAVKSLGMAADDADAADGDLAWKEAANG